MKLDHPIAVWCRNYEWKGHHEFIRDFTIRLAPYEPDPERAVELAKEVISRFRRRDPQPNEVENLQKGAYEVIAGNVKTCRPPDSSAPPNPSLQTKFGGKAGDYERLKLRSSHRHFNTPNEVLNELFTPDDHVALGRDKNGSEVLPVSSLPDLSRHQFVLPAAMKPNAPNRKAESILARRYYVHEFDPPPDDEPDFDLQSGYVMKLAESFDLRLVVYSGSKSLHAWFKADPYRESQFFRLSQSLGGDPGMALPTQFCRLPLGYRPGGGTQQIVYFK